MKICHILLQMFHQFLGFGLFIFDSCSKYKGRILYFIIFWSVILISVTLKDNCGSSLLTVFDHYSTTEDLSVSEILLMQIQVALLARSSSSQIHGVTVSEKPIRGCLWKHCLWHVVIYKWNVSLLESRNIEFEKTRASSNVTNGGLITVLCLLQQLHSRTVYPAVLFCCLSLTPSCIWGQSPAEGQMVSCLPLGCSLCLMCGSVAVLSFPTSSTGS